MSDNEKKEKVVTKYDLKMQRRQAEKEKELRNKKIGKAVAIVAAVAVVALIASFPIRTFIATHEAFITVNGEKVTRAEFDYNYNNNVNRYVNQYGAYLGYFGLDVNSDFATQSYSDDMSWKDYFEQMTVESIKTSKGLKAEAEAAGFTFDSSEEVQEFKDSVKDAAKEANTSTAKYIKQLYGQYASMGRVTEYVAENAMVSAYMDQVSEGLVASDEEIQTYYEENKDDYDSVDYYVETFPAEIPEDATEEQIEAAMNAACSLADAAVDNVTENGELMLNVKNADAEYAISTWLFDENRKAGDTVVLPDEDNHIYYALGFEKRYLDEQPTANAHIIILGEDNGQSILDEWNAGAATEESFIELWSKNSADTSRKDGLYENLAADSLDTELADWLFAEGRQTGDTGYVVAESGTSYVVYYVGEGEINWKADIADILLSEAQNEYTEQFVDSVVVEDAKGNLNYLKVLAEREAAEAEGESSEETGEITEGENGEASESVEAQ